MDNNPYLNTFILGDKSLIKKEVIRSYQENGISHLFAISGMHITLLSNLINRILRKKIKEESTYHIISLILIIYLCIVGFSPSILRGVMFYVLFQGNNIYYFYIKKENIFIVTLSIALLINPFYCKDIGFQYSYLISYTLLKQSTNLQSNSYIVSLLKVSITSFIVSLPITLLNYSQINLLSIVYNLLFVPWVSLVIYPLSLIVIVIKPINPLFLFLISLMEKTSLFLSGINLFKLVWIRLPVCIYILYIVLLIIYLNNKKPSIYLFSFLLLIHFCIPIFVKNNYITFIDTGQGDSIFIRLNKKSILVDTGENDNFFHNQIKPFLRSKAIKRINYLILTHGDFDHMGEAINLVNNFKVEKVIFNCGTYNDLEKELIKVLDKKKIKYYPCIKELNIDKNKLYFLQTKEYDNENDNSNVIYTELNGYKFMFMGDASTTTEHEILNDYNLPDIDVLKVGHHGSKTSSSKEFIDEINPKYSVISVGKNNRYGHPNKEVLNNLENSKIYRTDLDGSIEIKLYKNGYKIKTCPP